MNIYEQNLISHYNIPRARALGADFNRAMGNWNFFRVRYSLVLYGRLCTNNYPRICMGHNARV